MMRNSENLLPSGGAGFYFPGFLESDEADALFEFLHEKVPWSQQPVKMFGRTVWQPRLTAFYADDGVGYRYSGLSLQGLRWNEPLQLLKGKVEQACNWKFNSALLNLYRSGNDYMGWHRDNEKSLGREPVIASISLGATRKFQLRNYSTKKDLVSVELSHGDLMVLSGASQENWEHRLPKSPGQTNRRINITFRNIISP